MQQAFPAGRRFRTPSKGGCAKSDLKSGWVVQPPMVGEPGTFSTVGAKALAEAFLKAFHEAFPEVSLKMRKTPVQT
jgi:hypothetical protein